jgi:hypothetical protein
MSDEPKPDEWTPEEIERARKLESDLFDLADEYLVRHYGTGIPWRGDETDREERIVRRSDSIRHLAMELRSLRPKGSDKAEAE